ncbi:MAG: threonine--tRNA ligase [Bacteroidetes bacterium]|nr:threonine--tRNA ligase [Bacteroidota bacterium]
MSSIKITFPDGNIREYPAGTTALDIAKSISEGLARKVLVAKVNGEVRDAFRPINEDATLQLLSWEDKDGQAAFWHSSAHLMAEALESLFPGVKFGYGPPVENGFYYDVDLGGRKIGDEDLAKLEKKMTELAAQNNAYVRKEISKKDALDYFGKKGDEYKVETINELNEGEITFYQQGNFTDLCRGPHIPNTGFIKAVKLTNIAGAYWKGNENNKQLTRIYGVTFPKQKELDDYLKMLEEAKKRDHRKIGKELEIFAFDDDVGPGMPLWLPNGAIIIEQLEALAKKTEEAAGYHRVKTPHIARESMYLKSGHLPYYAESMFPPMSLLAESVKKAERPINKEEIKKELFAGDLTPEKIDAVFDQLLKAREDLPQDRYYLKSMNCPHHHKIFDAVPRSYKDLPLRLAEYGTCYRYEQSGELFGLMRVRSLNMNDAHIYCTEEQFASEFRAVNDMYLRYFKIFGIDKYVMRFSTHAPEKLGQKYVNEPELWKKTEDMVRRVLIDAQIPYIEVPDEAAFYGPKIDVQIWSVIGREFTLATNQVDFAQPLRFGLTYTTRNNQTETPICIHRAPLGTHERFIGFLIEHYAGNFPVWLSPRQVSILPIADRHVEYAKSVMEKLKAQRIRVMLDDTSEKIGKKIRDAEVKKIPYMLVIGDKEQQEGKVSVRKHGEGDKGQIAVDDFVLALSQEAAIP